MTDDVREKALKIIDEMEKNGVSVFDLMEIISADIQCNMNNCCISDKEAKAGIRKMKKADVVE